MDFLSALELPIIRTPTTPPGKGRMSIYFKRDGLLYKMEADGIESQIEEISIIDSSVVQLTNNSGGKLEPGNIVVVDSSQPLSVKTIGLAFDIGVIGVIKTGGSQGELVGVQVSGICDVLVSQPFPADVASFVYTGFVLGKAWVTPSSFAGAIGRALTSLPPGVTGTVKVLLAGGLPELN